MLKSFYFNIVIIWIVIDLYQGTKGITMFYMQTRNEDGKLNNVEVQVKC